MRDDLLDFFISKINEHINFIIKTEDKLLILKHAEDLRQFLISNPSLDQLRMFQALITYIWDSYGVEYKFTSRDALYDWLLHRAGHSHVKQTETTIQGERVILRRFSIKSLSFGRCPQKRRNEVINKAIEEIEFTFKGFSFEKWKQEWDTNGGTL